ncbi:MAG: type II toxin-antitoxin system PemK/MazF family toxin [Muricoprocola sp.]|uniref:type II toxin-antitoxin system PemK/MazF family toxin n=1 Tax=Blautia sp. HCP28S3_G10 TaxID=3438908 RepID=UPI003F01D158
MMEICRGDILMVNMIEVPGTSLQKGRRPAVVISNDKANTYSPVITVVPLTSKIKKKRYLPTHVYVSRHEMTGLVRPVLVLGEQVSAIAVQNIVQKCGHMSERAMKRITKAVKIQLNIED